MSYLRRLMGFALIAFAAAACSDADGPIDPGSGAPDAPANVTVTQEGASALVAWSATDDADSYVVERSTAGAAFVELASAPTGTSYTDAGVTAGTQYEYRVVAVNENGRSQPSIDVNFAIGLAVADLTGTINGVRTLSADTTYTLKGVVTVAEGGVLEIPAGTLILGDHATQPTALYVAMGGRVEAHGTADAPVVFTSSRPAGEREPGDWAGVMINGRAQCNFTTQPCLSEGIQRPFGGSDNDDDSGTLAYVRIEYAGYEVSFGNEMNGLTLNGVGRGTDIHHIQVHRGLDDGIEWFGGAVDVKYAIVTGASDDSFDFSSGWIGRGQFWIVQADPNDADRGFEVDNNEADNDATPRTDWQVYNVTLIGRGTGGTAGEAPVGITLRRGTAGVIRNAVVVGYEIGIDIDNTSTFAQCSSGELVVSNSIFFGNGTQNDADADQEGDCLDDASIASADPLLAAPYDLDSPDFRPAATSPVMAGVAAAPGDGFFENVAYLGAVAPDGTPWYAGWTTTDWE